MYVWFTDMLKTVLSLLCVYELPAAHWTVTHVRNHVLGLSIMYSLLLVTGKTETWRTFVVLHIVAWFATICD